MLAVTVITGVPAVACCTSVGGVVTVSFEAVTLIVPTGTVGRPGLDAWSVKPAPSWARPRPVNVATPPTGITVVAGAAAAVATVPLFVGAENVIRGAEV